MHKNGNKYILSCTRVVMHISHIQCMLKS